MPLVLTLIALVVLFAGGAAAISLYGRVQKRELANGCSAKLRAALDEYEVSGTVPIRLTSGVRTEAEQQDLWADGRQGDVVVNPDDVVTYAKHAYETAHGARSQGGHAIDFVCIVDGKAVYVRKDDARWLPLYQEVAAFFRARGFVVGVDWTARFPPYGDVHHVEDADWKSDPVTENVS